MRLTYLAHASLLVEEGGVRLVTDPWLDGPTYLGAWWHFPTPAAQGSALAADFVYLTHEHVDHFHAPTLAAIPRSTPILIGRYLAPRFRDRLRAMGFSDVRELPHGEEIALGSDGPRITSYQYRADDTALIIRGRDATVLDLNDSLVRDASLDQILSRHPKIDLLAASFANAEAYPIVYELEDPHEKPDWDDAARFDGFLDKLRRIAPAAFTPFASMFCFLSDDLFPLNDKIVSPAGLLERARREVSAAPLPMNPGDRWSIEHGHEVVRRIDWADKPALLRRYQEAARPALEAQRANEHVPGGRAALAAAFTAWFDAFVGRVPILLRSRLDLTIRFEVTGEAGQLLWLRFDRGRLDRSPAHDDAWDVRIEIADWPLHQVLRGIDTWQTLGISCRFRVTLRPRTRERELWFWTLLYLDDLGYLAPGAFFTARGLGVLARRRREVLEYARDLLSGRFVRESLRGKFAVRS
jgi:hypothetical protein